MQYIQLSDDSFILHTTKGAVTVNRTSFNFNRIKVMLDDGTLEECNLLPLLEPPEIPDGVLQLYNTSVDTLFYRKITDASVSYHCLGEGYYFPELNSALAELSTFLGVYASVQDIMFDYPEYFI
jgi:hypothetical protein